MQQRDDFKEQHVHKEAGMEFTIVLATHPESHADGDTTGTLVMLVERGAEPGGWARHPGVAPVATFSVEGVIVGDERTFDRVLFARADADALAALGSAGEGVEEVHATVLAPEIDELVGSITSAPAGGVR